MDDLRNVLDRFVEISGRLSALQQIAELNEDLKRFNRPVCGHCFFWMKSRLCPKEHNVNGYSRGPSCNGTPCNKYQENQSTNEIRAHKQAEIDARLSAFDETYGGAQ